MSTALVNGLLPLGEQHTYGYGMVIIYGYTMVVALSKKLECWLIVFSVKFKFHISNLLFFVALV